MNGLITRLLPALTVLCLVAAKVEGQPRTVTDGAVRGHVMEKKTGEPLPGVTVALAGTKFGAFTDLEGNFEIKSVPPGTYTLVATSVGYDTATVTPITVEAGESSELSLRLAEVMIEIRGMTVTGKAVKNTDATVLKNRQNAADVQDGISAQTMSRSGSGDAAEAVKKVVGASVVDGRYVYVRGLGGRYTNTQLNGAPLPSADPDRQAVSIDIVPSDLLDNIVVSKSFTPDRDGDFAGGSINLSTRDFPSGRSINLSTSTSYNSQTTWKDDVLTYKGGSKDWLASDDGTREAPAYIADPQYSTPNPTVASRDSAKAAQLDRDSRAINTSMSPTRHTAPLNQSYGLTYGDTWSLFGRPLGVIASLNYSRTYSSYQNGVLEQWIPMEIYGQGYVLDPHFRYSDEVGKDEVLWGGLIHTACKLSENHKIGFTYTNSRNGESTTRFVSGWNYNLGEGASYRTRSLLYSERVLSSGQIKGEHRNLLGGLRLDWQLADSRTVQDEPDLRYFSDNATVIEGTTDSTYGIFQVYPAHYFRNITERNRSGQISLSIPFKQWAGLPSSLKVGGSFLHKTREFRERQFLMNLPRVNYATNRTYRDNYNGDPDAWIADANVGIVSDTSKPDTYIDLGVTWSAFSDPASNYDASQDIRGVYGMVDLALFTRLQLITGLRYETTEMTLDQIYRTGDTADLVDGEDVLPAVSLIYCPLERVNVRLAYGRTLARPSFRELAPFSSWEFVGGSFLSGHPGLDYTKIDNYDLRWEWFPRPGELLAVSGFYKRLQDPIERVILNTNFDISWRNVEKGTVLGLEFEWRKRLDEIHSWLRNFQLNGNLSLTKSKVSLDEEELDAVRAIDPDADDTRQLQGQSPYLINADISYDCISSGTSVSLFYNRFGRRLAEVSLWAHPDVFEVARTTIDVTLSQKIWGGLTFKASAKNLTDSDVREVYEFQGKEYTSHKYSVGRTFGIGMSYQL